MSDLDEGYPRKRGSDRKRVSHQARVAYRLRTAEMTDAESLVLVGEIDVPVERNGMGVGIIPEAVSS
jgi:hypothetical protein